VPFLHGALRGRRDLVRIACEQAGGLDQKTWDRHVGGVSFPDPSRPVPQVESYRRSRHG
jgi:hypothetical protein